MQFPKNHLHIPGFDEVKIPQMVKIRQKFNSAHIEDIDAAVAQQFAGADKAGKLRELRGKRIAITAGSRGIPNYKEVYRAIVRELKQRGAEPFLFPAMGSHAGGTAEGQRAYLVGLGLTEDYLGCPVRSTMETVVVGTLPNGRDVHCDRYAYEADGIILCHKIKSHPNFKGEHESGLLKMICIGAGKHQGAATFHEDGFDFFDKRMVAVSELFLSRLNVICGIALCENAYDQLARIEVVKTEEIIEKDAEILKWSKALMARLYLQDIDLLVIDEIGKEISGSGFDGNIVGRNCESPQTAHLFKENAPSIKRIALLDLTEQSHGLAATIGMADLISRRLANKIDFEKTYINLFTSKICTGAAMPPYGNSDEDTIKLGILTGVHTSRTDARVVRIKNTLCLDEIEVSTAFLDEMRDDPNIELLSAPYELQFNTERNLW